MCWLPSTMPGREKTSVNDTLNNKATTLLNLYKAIQYDTKKKKKTTSATPTPNNILRSPKQKIPR